MIAVSFDTKRLPDRPDVIAPDGAEVRVLCALAGGSMAHFSLAGGEVSKAIVHRTVEEIWFVVSGRGEMWRAAEDGEQIVAMEPGICLTIPVGTRFQFRATGPEPLQSVAITMPPWPGEGEAVFVDGVW